MADIFHNFPINVSAERVFKGVATPTGLNSWWTKSSTGKPATGEVYRLFFGEGYDWKAVVSRCVADKEFELTITEADADWENTKVGFSLIDKNGTTEMHFCHTGWKEDNNHYRTSCYCWAMYLRILKRYLEFGEEVLYENRLDA
jgi:uncharacterized protein YndB with AHSA1/START domain